jgi:hypothetical protein
VDGRKTDPTVGVFHNLESAEAKYESLVILKGGVVLLHENEYAKAVVAYARMKPR